MGSKKTNLVPGVDFPVIANDGKRYVLGKVCVPRERKGTKILWCVYACSDRKAIGTYDSKFLAQKRINEIRLFGE